MPNLEILDQYRLVSSIIPPLTHESHKGQAGRIGIIGGCREYTGAPYFAAISALKCGCDLSFVFCTQDAAPVIKSYSPELIVYPVLDQTNAAQGIIEVLPRLHSLVIGPGLGRDPSMFPVLSDVIKQARRFSLPLVFDADGLHHISKDFTLISGYKSVILTPNIAEFYRLYEAVFGAQPKSSIILHQTEHVKQVASSLGNVTIVLKGENDIITDGLQVIKCLELGSPRRCGGQGDLLSGSLGTFSFWSHDYANRNSSFDIGAPLLAALGACLLTKKCARLAFIVNGRSMTTSDMITQISLAFKSIFT